ncbi:DDE Tnp4 domain-containing protein [Pycnococcus provasolii]
MGPPIPYGLTRASWRRGMRDLDDAGRLLALPNPPVNFILLLYAELISMYTIHLPRRARKHYLAGDPPFLNDFSRDEVHQLFGFRTHVQLRRVMIALGVPAIIRTRERYVYPGESAFLLMLVRLRDGRRWSQLERIFHRDGTHLSAINLYMVEWLYTNHSLPRLSNMAWVKARMPLYAQCIVAKLKSIYPQDKWNLIPIDIWSFIDGTIRPCAKPSSRSFPGLNLQVDFVRIAVEWGFKDINCTWRWLNDKHRNKLGETPLRKHYMNATFLSNLIVCVTGGTQTSAFFECEPPTLEEYLLMTNP